jgi:hypothetical protein
VPLRDPDLPHQVVIHLSQDGNHHIVVSCNCLGTRLYNGVTQYEPMGTVSDYSDTVRIYNDARNHKPVNGLEFGPSEYLRMPRSV